MDVRKSFVDIATKYYLINYFLEKYEMEIGAKPDGLKYNIENYKKNEIKALAERYNRLVDVSRKGISNFSNEDYSFIDTEIEMDSVEEKQKKEAEVFGENYYWMNFLWNEIYEKLLLLDIDAGVGLFYDLDKIENDNVRHIASIANKINDICNKGINDYDSDINEFVNNILKTEKEVEPMLDGIVFEELLQKIVKLNPDAIVKYQKGDNDVIYCSKNGSDLKLPVGFEYNKDKGIVMSGRDHSYQLRDTKDASKDLVTISKKEEKKQAKKDKKVSKETKTESKEKGSFGEVVSCLFGQVDKRVNNLVFKSESFYNWAKQKRMKRYEQLGRYSFPRILISAALMATTIWPGGLVVIPTIGLVYGAFVGVRTVGDLIRKAMNKPPVIVRKKEIAKGSYLENLKNAWNKFTNSKEFTKTKGAKADTKPSEGKGSEDAKDKVNVENLINTFNKVVGELDLDNIDLSKYDYCHSIYKTIENNGALDKLSEETKEKYAQYEKKVNEYKTLSSAFVKNVNELDINNLDKEALDRCQFIYNTLKDKFGDVTLKNIPSEVVNKFKEYEKALTTKKEPKAEELVNPYIQSLLQQMYIYDLRTTKDSVNNCEKLLSEIDSKIPETSDVRSNTKYNGLWKKYNHLKQSLVIKNKVLLFVEKVQNIKSSKDDVTYVEFKECMDIVNSFGEAEWKDFDSLSNASAILNDFQSILRNSRELILNQKLEELDIDKCINENNYGQLVEIVKLASDYEKEARDKHKAQPVNKLSEDAQLKLERVRQIVSSFGKFNEYKLDVNLTVNQDDDSIKAHYINYDGEEIDLILETKYTGSIEEVTRNVINEINAIEPLVSVDKINIHGLKYVKGTSKGSHR